ncbi:uncharacterized protein [Haliotis asinina]|uniref:uncharacterized protein n=1 Tax=Haliotis asinina TaxID=109174 RepID=UPI003531F551
MNLLPIAALCLFVGFATAQSGCNPLQCTSQAQTWASASVSGDKARICSAGRSYRDCLGSDCSVAGLVTNLLNQQGCGSERVWMSASSLLITFVLTKIFM